MKLFSVLFLPKKPKGSLIFETQKNRLTRYNICPKDSKKVKIFDVGSLEVYERGGGGGAQGLH